MKPAFDAGDSLRSHTHRDAGLPISSQSVPVNMPVVVTNGNGLAAYQDESPKVKTTIPRSNEIDAYIQSGQPTVSPELAISSSVELLADTYAKSLASAGNSAPERQVELWQNFLNHLAYYVGIGASLNDIKHAVETVFTKLQILDTRGALKVYELFVEALSATRPELGELSEHVYPLPLISFLNKLDVSVMSDLDTETILNGFSEDEMAIASSHYEWIYSQAIKLFRSRGEMYWKLMLKLTQVLLIDSKSSGKSVYVWSTLVSLLQTGYAEAPVVSAFANERSGFTRQQFDLGSDKSLPVGQVLEMGELQGGAHRENNFGAGIFIAQILQFGAEHGLEPDLDNEALKKMRLPLFNDMNWGIRQLDIFIAEGHGPSSVPFQITKSKLEELLGLIATLDLPEELMMPGKIAAWGAEIHEMERKLEVMNDNPFEQKLKGVNFVAYKYLRAEHFLNLSPMLNEFNDLLHEAIATGERLKFDAGLAINNLYLLLQKYEQLLFIPNTKLEDCMLGFMEEMRTLYPTSRINSFLDAWFLDRWNPEQ